MRIDSYMSQLPDPDRCSLDFMNCIESYLPTLLSSASLKTKTVDVGTSNVFQGDFYGLLNYLRIEPQTHYAVLRANGFVSPGQYRSGMLNIVVPDSVELDRLFRTWKSKQKTNI